MNLVDSCGWLEYPGDGLNAAFSPPAIENIEELIIPTLSMLEVFKHVSQQRGEDAALQATAVMELGQVVDLDSGTVMTAAKFSHDMKLPLADSVIAATAKIYNACLDTGCRH